ncbi:MAG: DedA family protein [Rhizobiaceae bacterium]|nr:DedA family protein [Rhizobiaceae bacterium]
MSAELLEFFTVYGLSAVVVILAIGQFGVPLPTSILLMTVGALLVEGDISAAEAFFWSLGGAVAGDQLGFAVGRFGGQGVRNAVANKPRLEAQLAKAEAYSARWGAMGVFLTRWLISPLGPMVNVVSGLARMRWLTFLAWDIAGETIWVGGYLALGYLFSSSISAIADLISNAAWLLAAAAVTLFLGWRLIKAARRQPASA